jgi:DNA repair protein RadC
VSLRIREEIQEMPRGDGDVGAVARGRSKTGPSPARGPIGMRAIAPRDRPRERIHRLGAEQLTPDELLAILLGSGYRGASALDVGRKILARAEGSLARVAARPLGDLTAEPGVGLTRAARIHAALELGRRYVLEQVEDRPVIRGAEDVIALLGAKLRDLPVEELHVLLLDSRSRLKRDVCVTRGTLDATTFHAREIFREAIVDAAAAVMLVHNHPSGDPVPSDDDIAVTERVARVGRDLGIPVYDHIIIGRNRHASVMERQWA